MGKIGWGKGLQYQPIDEVRELLKLLALQDLIATGSVAMHLGIAQVPEPLAFRIKPYNAPGTGLYTSQILLPGMKEVVSPIADHYEGGLAVNGIDLLFAELLKDGAVISVAIVRDIGMTQGSLNCTVYILVLKALGNLAQFVYKDKATHLVKLVLE